MKTPNFTVRLNPTVRRFISDAAEREGVKPSEYVRRAISEKLQREQQSA